MDEKVRIFSSSLKQYLKKINKKVVSLSPRVLLKFLRKIKLKLVFLIHRLKYLLKYGTMDFFNDLDIEINTSCNRRCSYCPNSVYERGLLKNEKLMKEETYKKIIDELAEINFSGRISPQNYGEPLIDKRLFKFMAYTRKKLPKSRIDIVTNGDYLTINLYKKLVLAGVNNFSITHHGKGMPEHIQKLFDYLKKHKEEKCNVDFYSIDPETTPLVNRGGLVKPKIVVYEPRCIFPNNPVVIDYAGNVVLCCNDYFGSVKFGNVEEQKLIDIWNSKKYKKYRKEIFRNKNFFLPICKRCAGLISKEIKNEKK